MPYLIDGHNVIAALPDIDLADEHDEAKLVLKLRAWTGRVRRKAIVIFDGGIPGGYARALSTASIKVIFAARHHTNADRIIRERVHRLKDAPNWTVVSSDREVRDNARQHRARVMHAQEFAAQLAVVKDVWKEKPDSISAAEVEEWLNIFPDTSADAPTAVLSPAIKAAQRQKARTRPRSPQPAPAIKARRYISTTRTIGEQVGIEPPASAPPPPQLRTPEGKPDAISADELSEWLDIFPEPTASHIPPPHFPKPKRKQRLSAEQRIAALSVNKEMDKDLAQDEIETWLDLFGGEPLPVPLLPPPLTEEARREQIAKKQRSTRRWAKYKQKQAPAATDDVATAEPDDVDLFRRMFGDGE